MLHEVWTTLICTATIFVVKIKDNTSWLLQKRFNAFAHPLQFLDYSTLSFYLSRLDKRSSTYLMKTSIKKNDLKGNKSFFRVELLRVIKSYSDKMKKKKKNPRKIDVHLSLREVRISEGSSYKRIVCM